MGEKHEEEDSMIEGQSHCRLSHSIFVIYHRCFFRGALFLDVCCHFYKAGLQFSIRFPRNFISDVNIQSKERLKFGTALGEGDLLYHVCR